MQRASTVLAALRLAEVVRYDTDGKRNRYRLKQPCKVRDVLSALSRLVQTTQPSGVFVETTSECFHVSGIPETWKFAPQFKSRPKRRHR